MRWTRIAVLMVACGGSASLSACERPRSSARPGAEERLLLSERSAERQRRELLLKRQEAFLHALRRGNREALAGYVGVSFVVDAQGRSNDPRPKTPRGAPRSDFFTLMAGTAGLPRLGTSLRSEVLTASTEAAIVMSRTSERCILTNWQVRSARWTAERMAILPRPEACDTVGPSILASLARRRR